MELNKAGLGPLKCRVLFALIYLVKIPIGREHLLPDVLWMRIRLAGLIEGPLSRKRMLLGCLKRAGAAIERCRPPTRGEYAA